MFTRILAKGSFLFAELTEIVTPFSNATATRNARAAYHSRELARFVDAQLSRIDPDAQQRKESVS